MKHPKNQPEDSFREEFAFDLTPNVDAGAASRMHRRRSEPRGERDPGEQKSPDDVEQGPTVRGCHWRVT